MRLFLSILLLTLAALLGSQKSSIPLDRAKIIPGQFTDIASQVGVNFRNLASHTTSRF